MFIFKFLTKFTILFFLLNLFVINYFIKKKNTYQNLILLINLNNNTCHIYAIPPIVIYVLLYHAFHTNHFVIINRFDLYSQR